MYLRTTECSEGIYYLIKDSLIMNIVSLISGVFGPEKLELQELEKENAKVILLIIFSMVKNK